MAKVMAVRLQLCNLLGTISPCSPQVHVQAGAQRLGTGREEGTGPRVCESLPLESPGLGPPRQDARHWGWGTSETRQDVVAASLLRGSGCVTRRRTACLSHQEDQALLSWGFAYIVLGLRWEAHSPSQVRGPKAPRGRQSHPPSVSGSSCPPQHFPSEFSANHGYTSLLRRRLRGGDSPVTVPGAPGTSLAQGEDKEVERGKARGPGHTAEKGRPGLVAGGTWGGDRKSVV